MEINYEDIVSRVVEECAIYIRCSLDEHIEGEEVTGYDVAIKVLAEISTPEALDALYEALLYDKEHLCSCLTAAWVSTAGNTGRDYLLEKLHQETDTETVVSVLYALHECWQDDELVQSALVSYQESENHYIRAAAEGDHDHI